MHQPYTNPKTTDHSQFSCESPYKIGAPIRHTAKHLMTKQKTMSTEE